MADNILKSDCGDRQCPKKRSDEVSNILKLITDRETGLSKILSFKSEITKLKAQQLKPATEEYEIEPDISYCKFLRTTDIGCIIGIWQKDMELNRKDSFVYHLEFEYNRNHNYVDRTETCPVVSELSCCGPFYKRIDVTDLCEKNIQGRKSLLYVGNTAISSGRIVLNVSDADSGLNSDWFNSELVWHSCKRIFSCTSNEFSEYFAVGTERGCFLFDTLNFMELEPLPGDVLSVEFSKNGSLLYCGIDNNDLMCYDTREAFWHTEDFQIGSRLGLKGVKEMKILSDEVSVVATEIDGMLSMMDLRMRKIVFTYPEYRNKIGRRPFSLDENLDLLCATGDHNQTTIWSLSSGDILQTFGPFHDTASSHACLITKQRRWFVAVVQGNLLTPLLY